MKTLITTTFTLLFCSMAAFGQDNFKPAYYITNQNDTVRGFINFNSDFNNSQHFEFRQNESDPQTTTFSPNNVKSYRFVNEDFYYVSREVEGQKYFLQYLVNGMMNLYFRADADENPYFYFEQQGALQTVTKKKDIKAAEGIVRDVSYKRSLGRIFYAFPSVTKKIEKLDPEKFNQTSMIAIAKDYHAQTCETGEECIVYYNQHPDKQYVIVRPAFSAAYGCMLTKGGHLFYPSFGAGISLMYPRISQNAFAEIELAFSPIYNNKNASLNVLKLNIECKYLFSDTKFAPFVTGGISIDAFIYNIDKDKDFMPESELLLGAGLNCKLPKKKNIALILGYSSFLFSNINNAIDNIDVSLHSISLKLKYTL